MTRIVLISVTIFLTVSLAANVAAQSKIIPIIDMKVGGLLGGVQNGRYLDARTTAGKLPAEQDYTLYLFDGPSENVRLKRPANIMDDICEDFFGIGGISEEEAGEMSEEEVNKLNEASQLRFEKGGVALGSGFGWNPQPRVSGAIGLNNADYKKIVADFLLTRRITKPELQLKQAVRIDLDGDGTDEVLLAATRVIPYDQRDESKVYDEYSVVLVRKIINGKPQTLLVAGEFYPRNRFDYDGNTFSISSILDLNGDGKMELVVYSEYYEGSATQVFELTGNKPVEIKTLSAGCGV